jgi:hypothetical protein
MNPKTLASMMADAAERLGFSVRFVPEAAVSADAAAAVIKGERVLFVREGLTPEQKADAIARVLAQEDLDAVYISPLVRETIEKTRDCRR